MKPSEIKVGATYRNRGAGKTQRTVLAISHEPVVLFEQDGEQDTRCLSSFAKLAGEEIVPSWARKLP